MPNCNTNKKRKEQQLSNPETNPRSKRLKLQGEDAVGEFNFCQHLIANEWLEKCEPFQNPFDEDRYMFSDFGETNQVENAIESLSGLAHGCASNLHRRSQSDFDSDIDLEDFFSLDPDDNFSCEKRANQDIRHIFESNESDAAFAHDSSQKHVPSAPESPEERQPGKVAPTASMAADLQLQEPQAAPKAMMDTIPLLACAKAEPATSTQPKPKKEVRHKPQPNRAQPKTQLSDKECVERSCKKCACGGKCQLSEKRHKWHCKGTRRTYLNFACTKCRDEWCVCPNENCTNVLKWNEDKNIVCTDCQLKNRANRKLGKKRIHWRWHRCLAEKCKALYVFNRGRRLKRSADKCGMLHTKKEMSQKSQSVKL